MVQSASTNISKPTDEFVRPFTQLPGDAGRFPLAGDIFEIAANPDKWMRKKQKQHGNIFWVKFFGFEQVAVIGPDANKVLMLDRNKVFSSKYGWDWFIGKLFPRGLMLRDFEDHQVHRRVMQSAFQKESMVRYVDEMNPYINKGLNRWNRVPLGLERKKVALDFYPTIKQLTLDLASRIFLGTKLGKDANKLNRAFVDCVTAGGAWLKYPIPGLNYRKGLEGRKVLEKYFYSALPAKRASKGSDMFSQLCHAEDEEGHRYTDRDVVDHMIFLLMAAHDTTTITMTTMIYELGKNPLWQERLRKESLALGKKQLDYEDLKEMNGIELVMKESMRLIAPVPMFPRKTIKDIDLMGYRIPKGTLLTVSLDYTHRMPEYWPNPTKFDPERFSAERREDLVHKYAFTPFGGGSHKCIGMHFADLEIKSVLHQMLLKYRWKVPGSYRMAIDYSSLPKPKGKFPVILRRL